MKKGFKEIVAWQYDGRTAIGVLYDEFCTHYISVAVNYFMDSNMQEGWLWYCDEIHKDEGTEIRLANREEIQTLLDALDRDGVPYAYDEETRTLRNYEMYPTTGMKVRQFFRNLGI